MGQSVLGKINYLTEEQYETAKNNGEINPDELYMTPDTDSYDIRGTVLYNSSTGENTSVLLSDDAENYEYLEIFYSLNSPNKSRNKSMRHCMALGDTFVLDGQWCTGDATIMQVQSAEFVVYQKRITQKYSMYLNNNTFTTSAPEQQSSLYIKKVVGYKATIPVKPNGEDAYDNRIYSTTETPIGIWIDGKTIYRTVFTGTTPSANNGVIIQIPNGDEVVNLYGFVNSWKTNRVPINSFSTTGDFVRVFPDTTAPIKILFNSVSAYFNIPFKIVVEYTKTTD